MLHEEAGCVREVGRSVTALVASAVDVKLITRLLPIGIGQEHTPYGEHTQTELGEVHHLACSAKRTAAVTKTELARDDEDVVSLLFVADLLECLRRFGMLMQELRTRLLTCIEIVGWSAGLDCLEYLVDSLTVIRRELLPPRDGEPRFGTHRE